MNRLTTAATVAVVAILGAVGLTACDTTDTPSAIQSDQNLSDQILSKYERSQPAPQFDWSQIRQTLIDVETAQASSVQTTSFFFNQGSTDPYYVCPSIGFPVASTTELTNPQKTVDGTGGNNSYALTTIAQIDPNGIYAGQSSGTYVLCVDSHGRTYGQYAEGFVHAVAAAATWDESTHRIVVNGAPTFTFKTAK